MYKKPFLLLKTLLLLSLISLFPACKFNTTSIVLQPLEKEVSTTHDLKDFTAIESDLPIKLVVNQGEEYSVESTVFYKGVFDYITIEVKNNTLKIKNKDEHNFKLARKFPHIAVFSVTLPQINSIIQGVNGQVVAQNALRAESLSLRASGASVFQLQEVHCSNDLKIDISGASGIQAKNLAVGEAKITLSGSSFMTNQHITAAKGISIHESGATTIQLACAECANATVELSGSSDIKVGKLTISQDLNSKLSGASVMIVDEGTVSGKSTIACSGSSDIKAERLVMQKCEVKLSGASNGMLHVASELNYSCSGSSDLIIFGQPQKSGRCTGGSEIIMK